MVVVPTLAKGEQRQQEAVAAGVASGEALAAKDVRERVDEAGAVEEDDGADEAPDEELPAGGAEGGMRALQPSARAVERCAEQQRDERVEAVEEDEFGILGEVLDAAVVGGEVAGVGDPAHVRPPEAVLPWRVRVRLLVRVLVVVPVVRRPPERAALDGRGAERAKQELHEPRGLEAPMREVAVVKPSDGEHPHEVERNRDSGGGPTPADPQDAKADGVKKNKRAAAPEVHFVRLGAGGGEVVTAVVGVEPLNDGSERCAKRGHSNERRANHICAGRSNLGL